jgi:dihydroorotate dehydrogenase
MSIFDVVRPALFALDPERAHTLTLAALRTGLLPSLAQPISGLAVNLFGLRFPNPVGLAAGFDKNAVASRAMLKLGFGFVEAGSVTPKPQRGNPKPRVFRLPRDFAVINRLGFNNEGHDVFARNLDHQRSSNPGIIGVNIGANKDSADPIDDYVTGVLRLSAVADYFVVNISSPNTPGLRDLQARSVFHDLLTRVGAARDQDTVRPPLLVKIAPDLSQPELGAIVEVAIETGVDGLIVSNTTVDRPPSLRGSHVAQTGGLSGRPLFTMSTGVLRDTYRISEGRLPLVGVGGIASGEDAYAKIKAGASLVQLYTGLIYQGPGLVQSILRDLRGLLDRDGVLSVVDVIGVDAGE